MDVEGEEARVANEERKAARSEYLPWVEKYRPKKLDELIAHEEIITILRHPPSHRHYPTAAALRR